MADEWIEIKESNNTWDQEKPIQGVYKRMQTNVGPNDSNQYVLDVDGEEVAVWGSTVLDNKFEQVPVGSEVRVEFLGLVQGKSSKYKDYKVQYKPTQASKVADDFGGELV